MDEIENLVKKNFKFKICCLGNEDKLSIFHTKSKENTDKILNFTSKILSINKNFINIYQIYKFPFNERGKVNYEELRKISKTN